MNAFAKVSVSSIVSESSCRRERGDVVCPKPRRVGLLNTSGIDPIKPLRLHFSYQQEVEAMAGAELLDIIVPKGNCGTDQSYALMATSPTFFCGSPPSRVSNPVIQDSRFRDEMFTSVSPRSLVIPSGMGIRSPTSSTRKNGGSVRASFGNNPAVRVEGFDCDRRTRGISALG